MMMILMYRIQSNCKKAFDSQKLLKAVTRAPPSKPDEFLITQYLMYDWFM